MLKRSKQRTAKQVGPSLAGIMAKIWAAAWREVRKKEPIDRKRQRLASLAQQHLNLAKEFVKIATFLMDNSNRDTPEK